MASACHWWPNLLVFISTVLLATSDNVHETNDAAFLTNETFRFVRPLSQSKEVDHVLAVVEFSSPGFSTENVVGSVNDEVRSETWH